MAWLPILAGLLALCHPSPAAACAVCYGAANSQMTSGMNMAIFTLLGVIAAVLAAFVAFFLFLIRRARMMARQSSPAVLQAGLEN